MLRYKSAMSPWCESFLHPWIMKIYIQQESWANTLFGNDGDVITMFSHVQQYL